MKKIIVFLLAAVVIFSFAKCSDSFLESDVVTSEQSALNTASTYNYEDNSSSRYSYFNSSSRYSFGSKSSSSSRYNSSRYNYSTYSIANAQTSGSTTPTFDSLTSLRDYLNGQKNKNIFEIPFKYTGSEQLTPIMLAQMVSAFMVNYQTRGDAKVITITEYPGEHIVDAYFSGNTASLTADEKKAMNKAVQMVSTAKSKAKNSWELELLIHDMLADSITYYDDVRTFSSLENAPRYLSIIGALLDGKANCQGYSDAFYTLASIAGFTVSRMNTETTDDLHVVNTIKLNGLWYVVDVTFDDQTGDTPTNYRLFNVGLDRIKEFFWKPWKEINPIAATSPKEYYYNYKGIVFNNAQALAQYVTDQWLAGNKTVRGTVANLSDAEAIKTPLKKLLDNTGKAWDYRYWCSNTGKDIYYTFTFK